MTDLGVTKLYIRMFDVDVDAQVNSLIPVGQISFAEAVPKMIAIVPVVYIVNSALAKVPPTEALSAARKITGQIEHICTEQGLAFSEVQLDCDWNESTRDTYFAMLKYLRDYLHQRQKSVSATIRLHQVKYADRTGIPPVDRGMLMYYNMGRLDGRAVRKSIYNKSDAELYTGAIKAYKLQLDAALPLFGIIIQLRGQRIIDLINKSYYADLQTDKRFRKYSDDMYIAQESFFLHGVYFMKDDVLKTERVTTDELQEAAKSLSEHLTDVKRTVTLFDLDSLNLRQYDEKDIQQVFSYFR